MDRAGASAVGRGDGPRVAASVGTLDGRFLHFPDSADFGGCGGWLASRRDHSKARQKHRQPGFAPERFWTSRLLETT
jgi:hypothetical protein